MGKSTKARLAEEEKTTKIMEKGLEGLQWRNFSDETEVIPSELIKRLGRHGTLGQKRRGKAKRTRRLKGRKRRRKKSSG